MTAAVPTTPAILRATVIRQASEDLHRLARDERHDASDEIPRLIVGVAVCEDKRDTSGDGFDRLMGAAGGRSVTSRAAVLRDFVL